MQERAYFIREYLEDEYSFSELCRMYRISRKTGYKWLKRYLLFGFAGLLDLSRARHHQDPQTDPVLVDAVVELRKKHIDWGPRKLYARLARENPDELWPRPSTIAKIIKREGLVRKIKRRARPGEHVSPFVGYCGPNAVWTADHKGAMPTRSGKHCLPLTVQDGFSRYLLAAEAVDSTSVRANKGVFERLFTEYGMPGALRSDNGPPFASVGLGGVTELSKWWIKLGIKPERIEPGRPSQNGRHERMHRTLKAGLAESIKQATAKTAQPLLDEFRTMFNEERPHEALAYKTPSDVYLRSTKTYPVKLRDPEYPSGMLLERVSARGKLHFMGESYHMPKLFRQELLGMKVAEEEKWQVYFGPALLGAIYPLAFRSEGKGVGKRRFRPHKR